MSPMHGTDFCLSGRMAHKLQLKKRTNVTILTRQINFLFALSKVTITYGAAVVGKVLLERQTGYRHSAVMHASYFYTPLLVVAISAYFAASLVLEVYETGVESLCLCFVQDKERNAGTDVKPFYMTEEMFRVLGKYMRPGATKEKNRIEKLRRQRRRRTNA